MIKLDVIQDFIHLQGKHLFQLMKKGTQHVPSEGFTYTKEITFSTQHSFQLLFVEYPKMFNRENLKKDA